MELDAIFIPRPDLEQKLDKILDVSASGAACVVWMFGDAGQGKTRFLKEYLERKKDITIAAYADCASPIGAQSVSVLNPYQPLKDVLEHLVANRADSQRSLALVKNISLTVLACIPFVGEVAYGIKEIRRDWNEYKRGERKVDFERFIEEYFETLHRFAEESPLLIVIDDAHWLDKQTVEAIERFATTERFTSDRVVFVLAARRDELQRNPELLGFQTRTSQSPRASEVIVPPFLDTQIRDYVQARFPAAPPEIALLRWLEHKTGGNPYYLQSYIQHLLSEELLNADGSVRGNLESYTGLPAEIRTVTQWLMKSLPEEDLTLLLAASTLGYEFSLHEISHLARQPVLGVIRALRRIRTMHGICEPIGYRFVNGRESTVYKFSQHAIHTALYNELTMEEREALHRTTAQYLNDLRLHCGDDPEVLSSLASALMLHARLGHQPEIEYESILLKARNASEPIDQETLLAQLAALAPVLGKSEDDLATSYRRALSLAPLRTRTSLGAHDATGELLAADDLHARASAVSEVVPRILTRLRHDQPTEALGLIEEHLAEQRRRGVTPHPLLSILQALALSSKGMDERSVEIALEPALLATEQPAYQAFARLAVVLLRPGTDVESLARSVQDATEYQGKLRPVLNTMLRSILQKRLSLTDQESGRV